MAERFRTVERPGVTVVILNRGRILLLKRINIPFITHPGIWYFVGGGRKKGESFVENAYREVREETGIAKGDLTLLASSGVVIIERERGLKWKNRLFVFRSATDGVKLNIEHRSYKWVRFNNLGMYNELLESIGDREAVLQLIGRHAKP